MGGRNSTAKQKMSAITRRIINTRFCRNLHTSTAYLNENTHTNKLGGFAKAFEKFSAPESKEKPCVEKSFLSLLRNSKFIDLGDPQGKIVYGEIYHIVGDDLYIDFGGKLPCVCTRPTRNANAYIRGAKVRLRIKDLELSTRFLGSERDMTLLEADAFILGLHSSPFPKS